MEIRSANFITSNTTVAKCPAPDKPEYAFIGRSNVGKSSLINMLCNNNKLAHTSAKPGKTQLINHFLINDNWYLVDLPGYGWAKVGKQKRAQFHQMNLEYLQVRPNLMLVFVLIDSRLEPQQIDLEFLYKLGEKGIPFTLVYTKADKLGQGQASKHVAAFEKAMLDYWEELPPSFITSSETGMGRNELLHYIHETNTLFRKPV